MKKILAFLIFWSVLSRGGVGAQDAVQVPDLTGMNVPQAAAALNHVGLGLGNENGEAWTAESGLEQNRIKAQSVAAGHARPVDGQSQHVTQRPRRTLIILRQPRSIGGRCAAPAFGVRRRGDL